MLILSYLLTIVLTSTAISIYGYGVWSWMTPVIMVCALVTYAICYFVEKHVVAGKFVMIGFLLLWGYALGIGSRIGQSKTEIYFWQWVLTGGDEAKDVVVYAITFAIAAAGFLGMVVYYFSKTLYRLHFLTLISLLPCVLYVKVVAEVDNFYLVLIAGLNLVIYICHKQSEMQAKWKVRQTTIIKAVVFFAGIVLFIAAIIPKEKEAKYYDQFEDLFLNGDTSSELSEDFSRLSNFSGNADNFRGGSNRRLYTIYGKGFAYLKRQNFDLYDFKKDHWEECEAFRQKEFKPEEWENSSGKLQLSQLQLAIKKAVKYAPNFAEKYDLNGVVDGATVVDPINNYFVRSQNFGAVYYLMTSRGIRVQINDSAPYMVSRSGTFHRTKRVHEENVTYQIYFGDSYEGPQSWMKLGGADFDNETAEQMLEELVEILKQNGDRYEDIAQAYLNQNHEAQEYVDCIAANTDQISQNIRELADRITGDCVYDWEKAYALQQYFQESGFVYDLKFVDKDTSPEHFLLESKTGTCSDFASAYVLLARAAGLTVRYAEGYVPEKMTQRDTYEITEADSHAYPEVFIQNIGWLVFEPTVASEKEDDGADFFHVLSKLEMDYGLLIVLATFAGVGILFVAMLRLVIPGIGEGIFRIRLKSATEDKAVIMAYQRLFALVRKKHGNQIAGMTPKEFADYLLQREACDIGELVTLVERVSYQGTSLKMTMDINSKVYDSYVMSRKKIMGRRGRNEYD